jgi:sulfur-oxidizing protein SoxX
MLPRPPLASALAVAAAVAAILVGCATTPSDAEVSAKAAAVLKASFREQGQAKLDRLTQDDTPEDLQRNTPARRCRRTLRNGSGNLRPSGWPADGKYLAIGKPASGSLGRRGMQY